MSISDLSFTVTVNDCPLPCAVISGREPLTNRNAAFDALPQELRDDVLKSVAAHQAGSAILDVAESVRVAVQTESGGGRQLIQVLSGAESYRRPSSIFYDRLVGLGLASETVRAYSWAQTALGRLELWSETLQAVVYSTLASRQPTAVWIRTGTGARDALLVPNLAFQDQFKSLDLTGEGARVAFGDRFDQLLALHDRVQDTQKALGSQEEAWTFPDADGRLVESYWDYEWLPVWDAAGRFVCTQHKALDISERVYIRKGLETTSMIRDATAPCRTVEAFCSTFTKSLGDSAAYLPFCLIYTTDDLTMPPASEAPRSICLTLRGSLHVPDDHQAAPSLIQIRPSLTDDSSLDAASMLSDEILDASELPWSAEEVVREDRQVLLHDMADATKGMGVDGQGAEKTLVCPIVVEGGAVKGFLVFGINNRRSYGSGYSKWTRLLAQHVNDGIARAWALEQAELQASRAQDLERLRGIFYKTISDEVKTPVSLILSSLSDVLELQQELSGTSKSALRRASRSSLKLLNLFDSLLDYFRLQAGQWIPTFQLASLDIITSEIVHHLIGNMRGQKSHIELECLPVQTYVDLDIYEKLILLMIGTLLRTIKRSQDGTLKVVLTAIPHGARLVVSIVKGNAVDSPAERVGSVSASKETATPGEPSVATSFDQLGLARQLQDSFVELLHGRSYVSDDVSRMVLELPTKDTASLGDDRILEEPVARLVTPRPAYTYAATLIDSDDSQPSTGSETSSETKETSHSSELEAMFFSGPLSVRDSEILLAIGDAETRSYCREALSSYFTVNETDTGQSLLQMTVASAPRLLILDTALSGMDSSALIVALRENAIEVPIVMLTARSGGEARADSLVAGAGELLVKPFSARELLVKACSQLQISKIKNELQSSLVTRTADLKGARNRADDLDQQLQALVRHSPIALFMLSADGEHLYQNSTWHELTGVPPDASPDSWLDYIVDEDRDRVTGVIALAIAEATSCSSLAVTWRNGNKTLVYVRAWSDTADDVRFVGSIVDVTELRHLEVAWAKASQDRVVEAQRMQKLQEQSVDVFSHESRSPLSAVMQATELLTEELQAIAADADTALLEKLSFCQELLSSIRSCTTHQKRIADDVLNFSKLNMQLLALDRQPTDILGLIEHVLKMFEPDLHSNGLVVERVVDASLAEHGGQFVLADPHRLQQVIINFLTNAIRYSADASRRQMQVLVSASAAAPPARSGVLRILPTDGLSNNSAHVWTTVSVRDFGRGLSASQQKQLFERFSQVRPNVDGYSGSGLGLLIAKSIVQLHGGFVEVDSTLGESTTFSFTIPAERTTRDAVGQLPALQQQNGTGKRSITPLLPRSRPSTPKAAPNGSSSAVKQRRNTVLVVDDSSINVKLLQRQLEKRGYDVKTGSNGQEALDLIDALRDTLVGVCLDVEMPIMNGLEAVAELRKRETAAGLPRLFVVAVTGNARSEQAETCKEAGYDHVIAKPYAIADLEAALERAARVASSP